MPTTFRSPLSMAVCQRYAASAISSRMKAMPSTAPPRSSMRAMSSRARSPISAVSDSTIHPPAIGSTLSVMPVSSAITCCVRSASLAECSVGRASASSKPFAWMDCAPPSAADSTCRATRTTLLSGCWAVSVLPPVWAWKRSAMDFGSVAPNRSRMICAHNVRAARNFAISSMKLEWALKKNDSRGAKRSTSSPASTAACTYAMPSASVKATSCTAVEPASRMWYPLIEMVLKRGISAAQYAKVSVVSRMLWCGGKM